MAPTAWPVDISSAGTTTVKFGSEHARLTSSMPICDGPSSPILMPAWVTTTSGRVSPSLASARPNASRTDFPIFGVAGIGQGLLICRLRHCISAMPQAAKTLHAEERQRLFLFLDGQRFTVVVLVAAEQV